LLEFTERHDFKPMVEEFHFDRINEAVEKLRSGKPRYRIVLKH